MKEQIKASEKNITKQRRDTQPIRCRVQNTVRMITELVEYGNKIKENMKATQSEIKKKYRESTVKGRKLGLKSMIWTRMKK